MNLFVTNQINVKKHNSHKSDKCEISTIGMFKFKGNVEQNQLSLNQILPLKQLKVFFGNIRMKQKLKRNNLRKEKIILG